MRNLDKIAYAPFVQITVWTRLPLNFKMKYYIFRWITFYVISASSAFHQTISSRTHNSNIIFLNQIPRLLNVKAGF